MARFIGIFLVVIGLITGAAAAQDTAPPTLPVVPKALGDPHPEGSLFMRLNHMNLMKHDRDGTVRLGDREIKYSIKECIACHVVNGPDALPISVENKQHFCRACHEFAAVKIDCFQCHNSKPDPNVQMRLLGRIPDPSEISTYLDGVTE